jgi:predicted RNA-binding protein (virulence factor B family)
MIKTGQINNLKLIRKSPQGYYLDGQGADDILLPTSYVPDDVHFGDSLEVFVYRDSEDRLIATTLTPLAKVGEFACLKVVGTNSFGAFLDWGLPKDLLVPFGEQRRKLREGDCVVVYVYLDENTDRVVASTKLNRWLNQVPITYKTGDRVEIMIFEETSLGFKAIINKQHTGIVYENEVFTAIHIGDTMEATIKKIRDDGKIDLSLQKSIADSVKDVSASILQELEKADGFLPFTDKTPATEIYTHFGVSKKNFKKALGTLYKQRLILLEADGIRAKK